MPKVKTYTVETDADKSVEFTLPSELQTFSKQIPLIATLGLLLRGGFLWEELGGTNGLHLIF